MPWLACSNLPGLETTAPVNAQRQLPQADDVDLSDVIDLKQYLNDLEKELIQKALINADWVVAKAAKALSLQRTTLVEKIKKFEIQAPLE